MRYVLPQDAIDNLKAIRKQYEQKTQVNLSQNPSFFGVPTAFGGKDIAVRATQISFIEKILCLLETKFFDAKEMDTVEKFISNLTASRVALAACLYVRSQISPTYKVRSAQNSELYHIIDKSLGMQGINTMDIDDKMSCFDAAANLLHLSGAFDYANACLKKAGLDAFSKDEWADFQMYLEHNLEENKANKDFANWPFTSIAKPLFGYVGSSLGATAGLLSGHLLSTSSPLISTNNKITATVSNGILIFGLGSAFGTPFVAPIIATKLVDTFLQIFLAESLHYVMRKAGESAGTAIGVPLDLAYQFLCSSLESILELLGDTPTGLSGLRISDGKIIHNGLVIESGHSEEAALLQKESIQQKTIQIQADGSFELGTGQYNIKEIMASVTEELKQKIIEKSLAELPEQEPEEQEQQIASPA